MKKLKLLILCIFLGGITLFADVNGNENVFKLTGTELKNNETLPNAQVYKGYGCNGGNVSPQLSWQNAPNNTKSFAIICHDPDAPRPNGWYHWLVVNIPNNTTSVQKGEKIKGALETVTDFGSSGYGGACPPVGHGIHRYNFTIYALDTEKLNVSQNTKPKEVEAEVLKHTVAKSTITGLFERK